MNSLEANIKTVNEKLQLLLKTQFVLKKENENLKQEVKDFKEKEVEYKFALHQLNQKVNILQAASGQMTEADQKEFEKRINQYIKEIDKCIAMLSD